MASAAKKGSRMTLRQLYSVPAGLLARHRARPALASRGALCGLDGAGLSVGTEASDLAPDPGLHLRHPGRRQGSAAHRRTRPAVLPADDHCGRHPGDPDRPVVCPGRPDRSVGSTAGCGDRRRFQRGSADRQPDPEQLVRLPGGRQRPAYRLRRGHRGAGLQAHYRQPPRDPGRGRPGHGRAADEAPARGPISLSC